MRIKQDLDRIHICMQFTMQQLVYYTRRRRAHPRYMSEIFVLNITPTSVAHMSRSVNSYAPGDLSTPEITARDVDGKMDHLRQCTVEL